MNSIKQLLTAAFSVVIGFASASAQVDSFSDMQPLRPVFSSYTIKAGTAHNADTYLSPIKYSGWNTGIGYERWQAMKFNPENWVMNLKVDLDVAQTLNSPGNSKMWSADIDASWAMLRRWKLQNGFSVGVGPAFEINAGVLYLSRNGNNPISAKAAITFNAAAYASYSFKYKNLPIILRYQAQLPAIGTFFSPDYGELYYEIYLGNRSGLAHCAWWGNYRELDHQLTADLCFGATWLRVGYAGRLFSSKVNDIVTRIVTHSITVGISGEWISLNPTKKLSPNVKSISATY